VVASHDDLSAARKLYRLAITSNPGGLVILCDSGRISPAAMRRTACRNSPPSAIVGSGPAEGAAGPDCTVQRASGVSGDEVRPPTNQLANGVSFHQEIVTLRRSRMRQRLKTLRGLTPYEAICKAWADTPASFRYDLTHFTSGLNT
jgi:hypothetical protein